MHYIVYFTTYENTGSKVFNTYNEAYKEAKELINKCEAYDYVMLCRVENNNKEKLIRVFSPYTRRSYGPLSLSK